MSGHLYVPAGSLGLEGFLYKGHTYTYFGLFPSMLRIPIFLFTHSLDGKLTGCSLLLAWLLTGTFTSMLIWRTRVMVRGEALMGRAEAATFGILIAAQLGGSVLIYLGANPWVFSEDKAWSVALSVGALFTLLGVLERPSWQRVTVCGLIILATALTRAVEGYACILGAVLVALWFAFSRSAREQRSWWRAMAGIAALALLAGCVVSWAKSGVLVGQAVKEYVDFHVLHQNQINGGEYFSPLYFPTNLWSYLGPTGVRFTGYFPFITLPAGPPAAIGGVDFFFLERSSSVLTSMPLLVGLAFMAVVGAVRRYVDPVVAMLRLLLVAAAVGTGAVLFYGTVTNRYLGDFLPFLFLASGLGLVFLWSKVVGRSRRVWLSLSAVILALAVFEIVANVAIAIGPNFDWTSAQATRYIEAQRSFGNVLGSPPSDRVLRGDQLPAWAPADSLFVAGDCNALYLSNGERPIHEPFGETLHLNWLPVEEGKGYANLLDATFGPPDPPSERGIVAATIGATSVLIHSTANGSKDVSVWLTVRDPQFPGTSRHEKISISSTARIGILSDIYKHSLKLSLDGKLLYSNAMAAGAPAVIHGGPSAASPAITLRRVSTPASATPLCTSLLAAH